MQFLAVVPDEEHFGFREWPVDVNAGQQVFTRSAEGLYVFGRLHTLTVPPDKTSDQIFLGGRTDSLSEGLGNV